MLQDNLSYTVNPASLAIHGRGGSILAFYNPSPSGYDRAGDEHSATMLGVAFTPRGPQDRPQRAISFSFGYYFARFSDGTFWRGSPTDDWSMSADNNSDIHGLVVSTAYKGAITLSLGAAYRRVAVNVVNLWGEEESDGSGDLFDIGIQSRKTLNLSANHGADMADAYSTAAFLFGLSFHNLGADFNYSHAVIKESPPRTMRAGLAIALDRNNRDLSVFSVMPVFELEYHLVGDRNSVLHYGVEATLAETIGGRLGRISDDEFKQITFGLTLSTNGLAKSIGRKGDAGTFWQNLSVEFSYARYGDEGDSIYAGGVPISFSLRYSL
jgi:hypothetical protein